jgi:histidine triad (HIT) family protein
MTRRPRGGTPSMSRSNGRRGILDGMDCIFCKIVAGTIPSKKLFEDDEVLAFADVNPQAPFHALIIPKEHLASLAEAAASRKALLGHLHFTAAELARTHGLANGYRVVINTGSDGGQTVSHLHLHLLGGRTMHWPPG